MRLLLDEMFPPAVARALRDRGQDVVAVAERPELISGTDRQVFAAAQTERRAVVTENVADFIAIDAEYREANTDHCGLVFVLKTGMPRTRAQFVGALARRLDRWLTGAGPLPSSFVAWP